MNNRITRFIVFQGLLIGYATILACIGPYLAEAFLVALFIWLLVRRAWGNPVRIDDDIDRLAQGAGRGVRLVMGFLLRWLKGL